VALRLPGHAMRNEPLDLKWFLVGGAGFEPATPGL